MHLVRLVNIFDMRRLTRCYSTYCRMKQIERDCARHSSSTICRAYTTHKVPDLAGHLCCVYMFGVEDVDTEESVAVAISVEAAVPSDEPTPPLRLKRAD